MSLQPGLRHWDDKMKETLRVKTWKKHWGGLHEILTVQGYLKEALRGLPKGGTEEVTWKRHWGSQQTINIPRMRRVVAMAFLLCWKLDWDGFNFCRFLISITILQRQEKIRFGHLNWYNGQCISFQWDFSTHQKLPLKNETLVIVSIYMAES